jgi:hypothetical protein
MNEVECVLPSGLSGIIKPWELGHLAVFTDRSLLRRPGPAIEAKLMDHAWVSTIDSGPYSFDGKPPWLGEVLQGDLFDAVRQARILTWGEKADVDFRCEDMTCRAKIESTVDLTELKVKRLTDEGREAFLGGNSISFQLPVSGRRIEYSLPTGRTMVIADKLARTHGQSIHVVLASRIRKIEGLESPSQFVPYLATISPRDWRALEDEFDRLNIGVDTAVEMVCPECGLEQMHDMMFGADFFMPGTRKRRKNG